MAFTPFGTMACTPFYFQEIRDRVSWEAVLKKFGLTFKKCSVGGKGIGRLKCVFHKERHPSLVLYDDGRFCCYGCGQNGDIFDFVLNLRAKTGAKKQGIKWVIKFFLKNFSIPPPENKAYYQQKRLTEEQESPNEEKNSF